MFQAKGTPRGMNSPLDARNCKRFTITWARWARGEKARKLTESQFVKTLARWTKKHGLVPPGAGSHSLGFREMALAAAKWSA